MIFPNGTHSKVNGYNNNDYKIKIIIMTKIIITIKMTEKSTSRYR